MPTPPALLEHPLAQSRTRLDGHDRSKEERDTHRGRRADEIRTCTTSYTPRWMDRSRPPTAMKRKSTNGMLLCFVDVVALTVKRRFSVRGDGGGMFMAMFAGLVLFRDCSYFSVRRAAAAGDLPKNISSTKIAVRETVNLRDAPSLRTPCSAQSSSAPSRPSRERASGLAEPASSHLAG